MKVTQKSDLLQLKIAALQCQQHSDWNALKSHYYIVKKSITLGAIVRQEAVDYFKDVTRKEQLFSTILILIGGYLSKKMVVGNSKNGAKKLVGYGIQLLTTQLLSKMTNK